MKTKGISIIVGILCGYISLIVMWSHLKFERPPNPPLYRLAEDGNLREIKRYPSSCVNLPNYDGDIPITAALLAGHLEVADYLLSVGSDIRHLNRYNQSILYVLVKGSAYKGITWMIRNNFVEKNGNELSFAASRGNNRIVRMLIAAGQDPSMIDASGRSADKYAAEAGFRGTAKLIKMLAKTK